MTDRWIRIQSLFEAASDLPAAEQEALIARACADDAAMRHEVMALLRADRTSGEFIGDAIARAAGEVAQESAVGRLGTTVGAYRLVGELGRGGMGTVYLADRIDGTYESQVAVKFLRGGLASPEMQRRFRAERQILAGLTHPNIARLLDGGAAPDGTPYLVMERIEGEPIDVWCDAHHVDLARRLDLFRTVCAAVEAAHRALVVHRDLKPANILVTPAGEVKLLDFGIAKLIGVDAASELGETTTAWRLLTPSYASPEQFRGGRITVATDIYALGVVLYRLIAGRAPYDVGTLAAADAERVVCDTEAPRPSVAAGAAGAPWARALRGDLDNIVGKAIRKEPEQRYGSVGALVEDIRRHQEGEPVRARPATWRYRAGKFVRRNTLGVAAAAVIFVLLAAFALTTAVQARRLAAARDRAEGRRVTAQRVTDFLIDLFKTSDPNESRGATVTARELLDSGAVRIHRELREEPGVRATLASTIGEVYQNLGLYAAADTQTDSGLAIARRTYGPDAPELASALFRRGDLFYAEGEYDSAAAYVTQSLAIRRRALGPAHADIAQSLASLGAIDAELGSDTASERWYREALAMDTRVTGDSSAETAADLNDLAATLRAEGKYDEAIPLLQRALALRRTLAGPKGDNLDVALTLNHLARTYTLMGQPAKALPVALEGLAIRRRIIHGAHVETAASLGNVAGILTDLGRYDSAVVVRRESLGMLRSIFGDNHPYVAGTLASLGNELLLAGRIAQADSALTIAVREERRLLPPGNPNIASALAGLGTTRLREGRATEAEPLLREALRVRRTALPRGHWLTASAAGALGECLTALHRYAEADSLLTGGLADLRRAFGDQDPRTRLMRARLDTLAVRKREGGGAEARRR